VIVGVPEVADPWPTHSNSIANSTPSKVPGIIFGRSLRNCVTRPGSIILRPSCDASIMAVIGIVTAPVADVDDSAHAASVTYERCCSFDEQAVMAGFSSR
jgi:hypothetical protein